MQIRTGVTIPIERDGVEVGAIHFDHSDVAFAERLYDVLDNIQHAEDQYALRAEELERDQAVDQYGIPCNGRERLRLIREICELIRVQIDGMFGGGTSAMVFGESLSMDAIDQFFDGITPYLEEAQAARIKQYTNRQQRRTALRK